MTAVLASPQTHEPERWTVTGADASRRLERWSEILATTHLAFDISATHRTPATFAAAVTRRRIDDLMLVDCAASPFRGRRSTALIGSDGAATHENILGFQFVWKGVERVREGAVS